MISKIETTNLLSIYRRLVLQHGAALVALNSARAHLRTMRDLARTGTIPYKVYQSYKAHTKTHRRDLCNAANSIKGDIPQAWKVYDELNKAFNAQNYEIRQVAAILNPLSPTQFVLLKEYFKAL